MSSSKDVTKTLSISEGDEEFKKNAITLSGKLSGMLNLPVLWCAILKGQSIIMYTGTQNLRLS